MVLWNFVDVFFSDFSSFERVSVILDGGERIKTVLNFGSDPSEISETRAKVEKSSKNHQRNSKAP